jgi:hypothetical protein
VVIRVRSKRIEHSPRVSRPQSISSKELQFPGNLGRRLTEKLSPSSWPQSLVPSSDNSDTLRLHSERLGIVGFHDDDLRGSDKCGCTNQIVERGTGDFFTQAAASLACRRLWRQCLSGCIQVSRKPSLYYSVKQSPRIVTLKSKIG